MLVAADTALHSRIRALISDCSPVATSSTLSPQSFKEITAKRAPASLLNALLRFALSAIAKAAPAVGQYHGYDARLRSPDRAIHRLVRRFDHHRQRSIPPPSPPRA
jgi:hypothetical protein